MLRKQPKFFQDPNIDYPIYDLALDFQNYIQQSKQIIANTRVDLNKNAEHIIECNAPFELRPTEKPKAGILLIHGLLDSPFIMRDIAERLRRKGLLVRAIMLPGHATVPGALLNTDYSEWLQAVRYGIATLEREVDTIFLGGFSTGASLALYHAAENPLIRKIFLIAPAFRIASPLAFLTGFHPFISHHWERAKWCVLTEEIDYVKYCSITCNAAYQVHRLALAINKIDHEKLSHCPLFFILSQEDKVVCSRASLAYFMQTKNPANQMLIYSAKSLSIKDARIKVRYSVYPDFNIINFSHITLPVSPLNPHYGKEGDYPLASRSHPSMKYGALNDFNRFYYEMAYRLKFTSFQYERLTFNPDFDFFMQEIEGFL